jgi:membrane-associated protease RseP (regulator of RpoE activity)
LPYPPDDPGRPALASAFPLETFHVPALPRKFRHRWWLHVALFLITLLFTTGVGGVHYLSFISEFGREQVGFTWGLAVDGLWYSVTLLAILGAHEFGHYYFCRRYDIDASLPYFIPAPIPLTGTLGAVIKIREPFPNRTILFDIGVGGPIAGFVVLVPALFWGMTMSEVVPVPTGDSVFYLGEPLLFRAVAWLNFGTIGEGMTINIHPMVFAAWFGMLATALNLLPFGQLDGGHITYATLRRWSTPISLATVGTAILMTYNSASWMFMTLMMLAMLLLLGPRHPRVIWEDEPLPRSRHVVAVIALVIFILCFTPVPIDTMISG